MTTLHFAPLIPLWLLVALLAAGLVIAYPLRWPRLIPLLALALALANPRLVAEESTPLENIALVIVDDSPSMALADRPAQREQALASLEERLKLVPGLTVRIEHVGSPPGQDSGTQLFAALDRALADIPRRRLAAVVMITDGQVHDVPDHMAADTPLHVLLVGHRHDRDRRLVIERAPGYAMTGNSASVSLRIDDPDQIGNAALTIRRDGGAPSLVSVPLNRTIAIEIPIDHPGPNLLELEAAVAPGELTDANNRAVVSITGVRDRLRVLLISGAPHSGERTWRNLLKADPAVDLVHFTILRGPNRDDTTPAEELALIPFPVRELFEERLHGFDLVILDRCRRAVLPLPYYKALADYVRGGGALLAAPGPEFAGAESPSGTDLEPVLPLTADGGVTPELYRPEITALGQRHPVTAGLPGGGAGTDSHWGRWARLIGGKPKDWAQVVMAGGPHASPLLALGHVDDGRVALLMSDTAWMWDRGWEGGGPQQELLRRLAHWLMKEPDLEEERLVAHFVDNRLVVERQSLRSALPTMTAIGPDGRARAIALQESEAGHATGSLVADVAGLWRVSDGDHVALAALGSPTPIEMADVRSTEDKLKPAVVASGGGIRWLEDGQPAWRVVEASGPAAAPGGWLGLRTHHERALLAIRDVALLPAWLLLVTIFGGLCFAWWREGK